MAKYAERARIVLGERLMGVLQGEVAEAGGSTDEVAARLLEHPAFAAALEELRQQQSSAISPGGIEEGDRVDRPKTVVWTLDSDDDGAGSSSSSGASWPRSNDDGFSDREPLWDAGIPDDAAALQQLAAQLDNAAGARLQSFKDLAGHQASDILCDQHWPELLQSVAACLLDGNPAVRRVAADELCRLFAAAMPGPLAFDIAGALGTACRQSLSRGIPLQELAGRVHFFTRALVALAGCWEALSEEQSRGFIAALCDVSACAAPGDVPLPSMLAVMSLVDPDGEWVRASLSRLGLRHAFVVACLDRGLLEEFLALVQRMPAFVQQWRDGAADASAPAAAGLDLSESDWRLLEVRACVRLPAFHAAYNTALLLRVNMRRWPSDGRGRPCALVATTRLSTASAQVSTPALT
jgi:hypothetical protein